MWIVFWMIPGLTSFAFLNNNKKLTRQFSGDNFNITLYFSCFLQSSDESVDTARVIVGPQNPAYGDVPYTLQPGLCGQEADYIHLTPDYIKSEDVSLGKSSWHDAFIHVYMY